MCIYIYVEREREREREGTKQQLGYVQQTIYKYMYEYVEDETTDRLWSTDNI